MKKWYIWIVALIVVVAGLVAISWIMKPPEVSTTVSPTAGPVSPAVAADLATYTNVQGEPWSVPKTGGDAFTVASQAVYPQFISGDVDPVDVSQGETQHMAFVIRDNAPITKAWAEVENDKSTDNIPLALGTSSAVSYNDIENQKYLVDSTGKLVINNGVSKNSTVADVIQSLFQKAEADQAMDYSYAGSWVVHDTRTINYHTTFYVEDSLAHAEAVLVWSDPCSAPGGVLSGDCSLTIVWGLDGTGQNLQVGNHTVSLVASTLATLVYNNGNNITLTSGVNGSKILIGTNTEIVKANLFYVDADGDGYAPSATMTYSTASSVSGYIRVASSLGTSDCDDSNAHIYEIQNVATDADHDYYTTGSATNQCVGVTSPPWYDDASGNATQLLAGNILGANDCNDGNADINPGVTAWWGQNTDYNCDLSIEHAWAGPGTGFPYTSTKYTGSVANGPGGGFICLGSSGGTSIDPFSYTCGTTMPYAGTVYLASGAGWSCISGDVGSAVWIGSVANVCH